MNRRLQDVERFNRLPECIEEFLDYGTAISCAFNPHGTLLATGTDIGYIGIWDFETRGLAKTLPVDSEPEPLLVTCVVWSANGRYLLSGHSRPDKSPSDKADKVKAASRIMLWDVLTGKQVAEVSMPAPVTRVCLTPRKPFTAVVSLKSGPPMVVDLSLEQPTVTPLDGIDLKGVLEGVAPRQRAHAEPAAPVALLSRCGCQVYVAAQQSGKGFLLVYDLARKQLLDLIKLPAALSSMSLNKQGSHLLLNCVDKVVRLADVATPPEGAQPASKEAAEEALRAAASDAPVSLLPGGGHLVSLIGIAYQLSVERELFVGAVFTHDNVHVACGSTSTNQHRIYLYHNGGAHLVSVLEGPRNDGVLDMAWHPDSNMIVTVSTTGRVYIWAQIYNEEWSAFAPDFKELHENEEYVEAEDEFDIKPPEPSNPNGEAGDALASARVDIVTRPPRAGSNMDVDDPDDDEEKLVALVGEVATSEGPAADPADKEAEEQQQQQQSDDASDGEEEAGPGASGRTGNEAAGGESDGGGTDQPRKRKAVRFEQYDDKAFEDLMRMQEDHLKNQGNKPTTSTGRRGRPPVPRPKEPEQQDHSAGGRGSGGQSSRGAHAKGS